MTNENNFRQNLRRLTILFGLIICAAFLYVITKGLLWTPSNTSLSLNIPQGTTQLKRISNKRYWISHFSDYQLTLYKSKAENELDWSNCDPEITNQLHGNPNVPEHNTKLYKYCAILAETNRTGVLIRYVQIRPIELGSDSLWLGGFINPNNGNIFNLLGRKY